MSMGRMLRVVTMAAPLLLSSGVALAQAGGGPTGGSAGSEGGGTNPNVDTGGTADTHKARRDKRMPGQNTSSSGASTGASSSGASSSQSKGQKSAPPSQLPEPSGGRR